MSKKCSRCRKAKPLSAFHRRRASKDGRQNQCKKCGNETRSMWDKMNPLTKRAHDRKHKHGILPEEYARMVAVQGDCCGICGVGADALSKALAVDHDHKTGNLRGLLCSSCNIGLGNFKDDPARLAAAIHYLEEVK